MVVLHYTGMETTEAAAVRLCDPEAEVSAHYLISPEGRILQLVDENMRAWHAGAGSWGQVRDVNSHSIGIEIANPGHHLGYPPFPEPQMAAVEGLLAGIMTRWRISAARVVGHACIAPGRKIDPGEKFDWRRLARQGLAVWVDADVQEIPEAGEDVVAHAADFQEAARRIGYGVPRSGAWDEETLAVWHAFAMRFLPARATCPPDAAGVRHACRVAAACPVVDPVVEPVAVPDH